MRNLVLIAACLLFSAVRPAGAQTWTYGSILDDPAVMAQGERGLAHLYDMRFEEAGLAFDSLEVRFPDHPIVPFLDGLLIWWQILPDLMTGDTRLDRPFLEAMDRTIRQAERLDSEGPHSFDAKFFKAAAFGFRGRLLSNRREWFRAARDGKEALDLVFDMASVDPENPDLLFGRAVYDYFAAVIPEQYPLVRPLMAFFPGADKARGLEDLDHVSREARFVATEAAYFLLQIHFMYEPDYTRSLHYAEILRERHPENAFFHVLEGRVHARWGRWASSRAVMDTVVARSDADHSGYGPGLMEQAFYYRGRANMALGAAAEAERDFESVFRVSEPDSYYAAHARLRRGMLYDLAGDREAARAAYQAVIRGGDHGSARDRARTYLERPYGS